MTVRHVFTDVLLLPKRGNTLIFKHKCNEEVPFLTYLVSVSVVDRNIFLPKVSALVLPNESTKISSISPSNVFLRC